MIYNQQITQQNTHFMGLFNAIMGNASEVNIAKIREEFQPMLVPGEEIEKAYKVIRDMFVFTNKRLILVDKQGITGSKVDYLSIPYTSIIKFSKESAGLLDMDADLKIWVRGEAVPIKKQFGKDNNINEVYQILSRHILK